jgi:hypothetical protein
MNLTDNDVENTESLVQLTGSRTTASRQHSAIGYESDCIAVKSGGEVY